MDAPVIAGRPLGEGLPNTRARRLVTGRGQFVANRTVRCLEAAIVRSTVAHGRLVGVDVAAARTVPGVIAVYTAREVDGVCAPWRAEHALFAQAKVPQERPLAADRVRYVGEPVAIVVAETALAAQDGAEAVTLSIEEEPALMGPQAALSGDAPALHEAFAGAQANLHAVITQKHGPAVDGTRVSLSLTLSRVAPQPLETRAILAHWDAGDGTLTVEQSHQHPHQMQDIYARLLGVPEHKVRVVCRDVGGAFGLKQQLHPDEMAVVCASRLLAQPVRYVPSRGESLLADAQARDHHLEAHATLGEDGTVRALALRDQCGIGAFPHFPRTSFGEAAQAARLFGAPYRIATLDAEARLVFQNRPHLGHYRGVGQPVACLATEALMDRAARAAGEDPLAFRRRHLRGPADLPAKTPAGIAVDRDRIGECLDALAPHLEAAPRGEHDGLLHGVGVACLLELFANGPRYYGEGGVAISSDESAVLRMEPSGTVRLFTANTDQGQGADQALAQIAADVLGIAPQDVAVVSGDSEACPYGGGAFGSRGTALGGRAAHDGAKRLAARLLANAAALLQRDAATLHLAAGAVRDASGSALMTIAELARTAHFKPYLFPEGHDAGLVSVGRHTTRKDTNIASAAFAARVAVEADTGVVHVRGLYAAHDAGTIVNPAAVDGQLHGSMIQGLGQAMMEAVRVDAAGQPLTGSLMDYALPRADDAPPIKLIHLPPLPEEDFAPRGVGEAGMAGAPASLFNAVNDALSHRGASLDHLPMTPQSVWRALHPATP